MQGIYKIITLCGSTRFKDEFMEVQKRLTLAGNIVISVGLFGHSGDNEVWEDMDEGTLTRTKEMLDDNQACCACIPYDGCYEKYLFFFLMAQRTHYIKMGEGGAQPNISKDKIVNSMMPLPPLAEQRRIFAKPEELLPLCEKLKKVKS